MVPGADAAAFRRGDYATAYRLTLPGAMHGDKTAQHNLGILYERGLGVPHDDAKAAYWYHSAAVQGQPMAADDLAQMYASGRGIARDRVQSYLWFTRAASYATNATDRAATLRNRTTLVTQMTPAELTEARRLAGAPPARRRRRQDL